MNSVSIAQVRACHTASGHRNSGYRLQSSMIFIWRMFLWTKTCCRLNMAYTLHKWMLFRVRLPNGVQWSLPHE